MQHDHPFDVVRKDGAIFLSPRDSSDPDAMIKLQPCEAAHLGSELLEVARDA